MSNHKDILLKWVSKQIGFVQEDGCVTRVSLMHAVEGENPLLCETFEIEKDGADAGELTDLIWGTAEHDASTRSSGAPQRYVAMSFIGDASYHSAAHPFVVVAHSSMLSDSEPATEKGIQAHYLRHDENMHRFAMQLMEGISGKLARENDSLRRSVDSYTNKLLEMAAHEQTLLDKKHERDMERARQASSERRHEEFMGLAMALLPIAASKLLGAGVLPNVASKASRDEAVGRFLKSLSQDDAEKVISSLPPDKSLALIELYKSYAEEDAARQAATPEPLKDPAPVEEQRH